MILTVTANAAIDKRYVTESFERGAVNRVKTCVANAGGKGINVARVASIAGEEVCATGFLGGHAGHFIQEHLETAGIRSDFVWCDGESRTCINIWDETRQEQTEFLEPGFTVTEEDCEKLIAKVGSLLPSCSVLTISGSTPKGADGTLYRRLVRMAGEAGVPVLLDTSGRLLVEGIQEKPYLIKPNIDEIRQLTGRSMETREELLQAAEELHDAGIAVVVISLGGDGSLISSREGVFEAKVPALETVNTVGCGDSMIAGFAASIARGLSIEETIRLASAVAAANALRQETGFIVKEDADRLLPQIRVERIR